MQVLKRVIATGLASLLIAGTLSCSALTDPTYEFMTLQSIDGKALPATIKFGPDSISRTILRGRLGFSNASISLHCRVELVPSNTGFDQAVWVDGSVNHPRCDTGGSEPLVVDLVLQTPNSGALGMIKSATQRLSFAGLIRTKSPEY